MAKVKNDKIQNKKSMSEVLPIDDIVIFPQVILPFHLTSSVHMDMIDRVLATKDRALVIVTKKNELNDKEKDKNFYTIGTYSVILKMLKLPDNTIQILVQGINRVKIDKFHFSQQKISAEISPVEEIIPSNDDIETEAIMSNLKKLIDELIKYGKNIPKEFVNYLFNISNPSHFADLVSTVLEINSHERQKLLETLNVKERLNHISILLNKEIQVSSLSQKIQDKVSEKLKKNEKDFLLREQLKAIHKELGDVDEHSKDVQEFRKKIKAAKMPKDVEKEAMRELRRFEKMHADSAEGSVIRTYLEWLCELPWKIKSKNNTDMNKAEKNLDTSHYGLKKVKERIMEFLAVQKLKKKISGPILCFVGPPGVGKTSLGKAIAEATGKKYVRMSLGGVHDEAEIRGHRKTYIGAMPGRIIQGIKQGGTNNPVFVLDEIDKLTSDFRGDPASALLEVLDPEQNNTFVDHYLNVPFDLSDVMFIATANTLTTIPAALKDRIEVIHISGYTYSEKIKIVRKFLLPKQLELNGLSKVDFKVSDKVIEYIIQNYTREAGVRNIDRIFARICRKIALIYARDSKKNKFIITRKSVQKFLGAPVFVEGVEYEKMLPGIVPGLAWTQFGGEVLYIEAIKRPGKGGFTLTGQLGDVMKESAQIGYSLIKSILSDDSKKNKIDFSKYDIHIHVPTGAIPKDGPSAGITMATAIYSLFTGKVIKSGYAMTGEVSLTGRVLPIGGLKEKSLAAYREGYRTIVIPEKNLKDVEDIPEEIKKNLKFKAFSNFEQIIKEVF
ncbi:MAG: endopeptidase La [Candidatus Muiribacteriota bacterium]